MCLAVHLASPSALPLVPWRDDAPGFFVREATPGDPVRAHFRWPCVVYAGAHERCGCGFAFNQYPDDQQDPEAMNRGRADLAALRAYVIRATASGPVELYACWEGEQHLGPTERLAASPDILDGRTFQLPKGRMLVFPASPPARDA